ncbi:MAG: response regulator [Lachnospiraceae bacterium]|nr:response regulator [Lachnospiraceae bacterium]
MSNLFSEMLKKLRTERGLSQTKLGKQLFVNQSTIARWESGTRLPDAAMITLLSGALGVDVNTLLQAAAKSEESPHVIIVDDEKIILSDSLTVLDEVMPAATIRGFMWPQEAIEYARMNPVALAVLDIELGTASGFDLCKTLLDINSRTNVVYLTAFPDYALPAWESKACGFMVKPLTPEKVHSQLENLRYPFSWEDLGGEVH